MTVEVYDGGKKAFRGVRVYTNTAQTMYDGGGIPIYFDIQEFDTHGMHDANSVAGPSVLTLNKRGVWMVMGAIAYQAPSTAGQRQAQIMFNGSETIALSTYGANASAASLQIQVSTVVNVTNPIYYVQLYGFQNSGVNIDTYPGYAYCWFAAAYLGG